jgi:hypothetical protein
MVRLWRVTSYSQLFHEWMMLGEEIFLSREIYGGVTEGLIPGTIRALARDFLNANPIPVLSA